MWDFLDRLREKPEAVRLQIAIATALVVTVFIVAVWLSVIDFSLDFGVDSPVIEEVRGPDSPLGLLGQQFSDLIDAGGEQLAPLFEQGDI